MPTRTTKEPKMPILARAAALPFLLFATLGLSGCGGSGDAAISDPTKLAPLTAEQQEEIRKHDAQVEDEERGVQVVGKKSKGR
jgi:hypothetical protein